MNRGETAKQPSSLARRIKSVVAVLVLVSAAVYIPAKPLAARSTNRRTELRSQGNVAEAMAEYERSMKVYPSGMS